MDSLILGPPTPIGTSYFDQTLLAKAKLHGAACPVSPPTDAEGLNSFVLLNYYDLPLSEYVAYWRSKDATFQTLGRKCADSWWKHPDIGEGKIQRWPDSVSPVPRHAGILGLICRAMDGRPEMWPWITGYVQFHLNHWCVKRVKDPALFYGLREGAFCLHYAVALAKVHPDTAVRAQLITDIENVCINYYGRLQQADGSWRWDDVDYVDSDGGTLKGIMQAFMVGLLLCALSDAYEVVGTTAKASIKTQILTACRHLYEGGPYTRIKPVNFNVLTRGFNYFYHGGTTVNPTKYAKGDIPDPWGTFERWHIESARQAISTVVGPFGKAYQLSGDPFFKSAGDELWDSAYGGGDGFRAMMADTPKNFNQHARWAGRYPALVGSVTAPEPAPLPTTPPPDPVKDTTAPIATITQPVNGAVLSGKAEVKVTATDNVAVKEVYLFVDGVVSGIRLVAPFSFTVDTTLLTDGPHVMYVRAWDDSGNAGDSPKVTFTVSNVPTTTTTTTTTPPPIVEVARKLEWPKQISKQNAIIAAQWKDRYRLKGIIEGIRVMVEFEKV